MAREVDDELEFGCLQDRQVGGLGALEDLNAAGELEREGLIERGRRQVTILNRLGLMTVL